MNEPELFNYVLEGDLTEAGMLDVGDLLKQVEPLEPRFEGDRYSFQIPGISGTFQATDESLKAAVEAIKKSEGWFSYFVPRQVSSHALSEPKFMRQFPRLGEAVRSGFTKVVSPGAPSAPKPLQINQVTNEAGAQVKELPIAYASQPAALRRLGVTSRDITSGKVRFI